MLEVDEKELLERLRKRAELEGRKDDNVETVRTRMAVFKEQTAPLIDYYRSQGILVELDGSGSVDEVAQRIDEALAA